MRKDGRRRKRKVEEEVKKTIQVKRKQKNEKRYRQMGGMGAFQFQRAVYLR